MSGLLRMVLSDTGCHALANERLVRMMCPPWPNMMIISMI